MSQVWNYFTKDAKGSYAACNRCDKKIKCEGGNTSGLAKHLKTHNISLTQKSDPKPEPAASHQIVDRQRKLPFSPVNKPSLEEEISRLAAVDMISFNAIANSQFIQESLRRKYDKTLTHPSSIKEATVRFASEKKFELRQKFELDKEAKYTLGFDEWTSGKMRRYLTVILYSDTEVFNLGMIRITGSCTAKQLQTLVDQKLNKFGLSLNKSIVAILCDGASVNIKFGNNIGLWQQLCLNHGLHLAVTGVLYGKKNKDDDENQEGILDRAAQILLPNEEQDEVESRELSDTEYDDEGESDYLEQYDISNEDMCDTIEKVRKLVKFFRKSPLRTEILQKHVEVKLKKTLELLLDCKTRWDSLCKMLERFLKLLPSVKEALMELGCLSKLDGIDEELVQQLVSALTPIKDTVEWLSSNEKNLLIADLILEQLLSDLNKQSSAISHRLFEAVLFRVNERRVKVIASIAKYLQNPSDYSRLIKQNEFLSYCTKAEVVEQSIKLLQRLYESDQSSQEVIEVQEQENTLDNSNQDSSFRKRVQNLINKATTEKLAEKTSVEAQTLKKEFRIFEATAQKTQNIKRLEKCVFSIRPSSTEPERTFSIAEKFVTKIRNKLSDIAIDALIFLKFWFTRNKIH